MLLPLALLLAASPPPPPWDCSGNLTPPAGYEQETAFAPPGATQQAVDAARERLLGRICQDVPCPEVAGEVAPWRTGSAPDRACAMAVVPVEAVGKWRNSLTAADLDGQLDRAVAALLGESGKAVVALGPVRDPEGGDERGRFLRDAMLRALSGRPGVAVRDAAAAPEGAAPPKGSDALLSATAYPRREGASRLIEVRWTARAGKAGDLRAAPPILVPEQAIPRAAAGRAEPAPAGPRVQLTAYVLCQHRLPGGGYQPIASCTEASLAEDDRVKLVVEVDRPARLYVIDSNASGQFQTLFPDPGQDNSLAPGRRVSVPAAEGEWLELDAVQGVVEHFQVVASAEPVPELEALRGADVQPGAGPGRAAADKARALVSQAGTRGFKRKAAPAEGAGSLGAALAATVPLVAARPGLTVLEFQLRRR